MLSPIHFASLKLSVDFHPHLVSPLRGCSPLPAWRHFSQARCLVVLGCRALCNAREELHPAAAGLGAFAPEVELKASGALRSSVHPLLARLCDSRASSGSPQSSRRVQVPAGRHPTPNSPTGAQAPHRHCIQSRGSELKKTTTAEQPAAARLGSSDPAGPSLVPVHPGGPWTASPGRSSSAAAPAAPAVRAMALRLVRLPRW